MFSKSYEGMHFEFGIGILGGGCNGMGRKCSASGTKENGIVFYKIMD
jgi:hypothetical protein